MTSGGFASWPAMMITEIVFDAFGTFVETVMRWVPTESGLLMMGQLPMGVPLSLHASQLGSVTSVRMPRSPPPVGICVGPRVGRHRRGYRRGRGRRRRRRRGRCRGGDSRRRHGHVADVDAVGRVAAVVEGRPSSSGLRPA